MSFEGFYQYFCINGHFGEYDVHSTGIPNKCYHCGAGIVIENLVDDTNCDQFGVLPPFVLERLLITPATKEQCNLGHVHETAPAVYRVPSYAELESLRHWLPTDSDEYEHVSTNQPGAATGGFTMKNNKDMN